MAKNSPLLIDIGQGLSIMAGLPTVTSWDSATRPKDARPGTFGFNTKTNNIEVYDGTSWYAATLSET